MSAPSALAALFAQGLALHQAGRLDDAVRFYEAVLRRQPSHADALHHLGLVGLQSGRTEQGAALIAQAIAANPMVAAAHTNLATALLTLGRPAEALVSYDRALALAPAHAEAHYNRATALRDLGDLEGALAGYERTLALQPEHLPANINRAALLTRLQRFDEALAACDAALAAAPDSAEAHSNKARILNEVKRSAEALAVADRALALRAGFPEALNNRAIALVDLGRPTGAVADCDEALAANADFAEAHNTRGTALYDLGRPADALASYDRALALKPGFAEAHFNRATSLLALGDLRHGFAEYRWRWRLPRFARMAAGLPWPAWEGEALAGKSLLVRCEQGFGDALQFIRFVQRLAANARVTVLARPELVRLFRSIRGVAIIDELDPAAAFDFQVSLMCLPRILGATLETLPTQTPYLSPDSAAQARWAQRFGPRKEELRVGLVWAGDARRHDPTAHATDLRRSLSLAALAPLGATPGARFFSLQTGEPSTQVAPAGLSLADWTGELLDFAETAALIAGLDLVVTVDTAVAHLAGGLGKPVWILSRFAGCWRWLNGREDSPWYPTARLFHQAAPGAWDEVVARVAAELAVFKPARVG